MASPILYCGDTTLDTAAAYLAGLMTVCGWDYDYVCSEQPFGAHQVTGDRKLFIFSDYPAARIPVDLQQQIVDRVQAGAGLLMIGGWESFHGQGGNWDNTPIGDLLGVGISTTDDRQNNDSPAMLLPADSAAEHPILQGLPWRAHPAFVGGWNRVSAGTATVLLSIQQFEGWELGPDHSLTAKAGKSFPGLTVNTVGSGRAVAYLPDVAPHWVGGMVDWGPERLTAQAPRGGAIEVGSWYGQFWRQLLTWTGQLQLDDVTLTGELAMRPPAYG